LPEENPRRLLLDEMEQLAKDGKTCANCSGVCCTFVANSMLVTPAEASTLIDNLKKKNLLTPELKEHCRQTIIRFSLDRPVPGTGQRNLLRRRYTCPLFQHKALGCPLDSKAKPYGCLAFNPQVSGEVEGKSCGSNKDLLKQTDKFLDKTPKSPTLFEGEKKSIPDIILSYFEL